MPEICYFCSSNFVMIAKLKARATSRVDAYGRDFKKVFIKCTQL